MLGLARYRALAEASPVVYAEAKTLEETAMDIPVQLEALTSDPSVRKVVVVVVGMVLIFAVRWIARATLMRRIEDGATRYRARKVVAFGSYLVLAVFVAIVFSDKLGGFTVALGVAGAGIAFALQEVIVSIAGWIAITFAGFYKIGDRVMLGGIRGDVIDIGVLRTTLFEVGAWVSGDLYNGRVVRLANSFVFREPVFNYSADFPFLWDEIEIPIRHGSDRALGQQLLESAATDLTGEYAREVESTWDRMTRNYVIEHAQVAPMVTMVMDANWMTYTVRYVVEFKKRRRTKHALFQRILNDLDATAGRVSVASVAQEVTLMPTSSISLHDREGEAHPIRS